MNKPLTRLLACLAFGTIALGFSSCTTVSTNRSGNAFQFDPPVTQPSNPSRVSIKLSTGAQRLYVVEGDKVLLATPVAVGKASTPTPKGNFRVRAKSETRRRQGQPGRGYPMPYWIEFYSASYGMHWGFVKPYPCTHGCVRMPLKSAKKVFNLVRVGTPINISSSQPWDATIGKTLPVLDDSPLPNPPHGYMMSPKAMADIRQGKLWNF
jgi:lipoprotein-anchoring transpeptidase ErfK/SrfK